MKKLLKLVIAVALLGSALNTPLQAAGDAEDSAPGPEASFCQPQSVSTVFPVFGATGVATDILYGENGQCEMCR